MATTFRVFEAKYKILSSVSKSSSPSFPVLFRKIFRKVGVVSRKKRATLDASARYRVNVRSSRHAPIARRGNDKEEISRGGERGGGRE